MFYMPLWFRIPYSYCIEHCLQVLHDGNCPKLEVDGGTVPNQAIFLDYSLTWPLRSPYIKLAEVPLGSSSLSKVLGGWNLQLTTPPPAAGSQVVRQLAQPPGGTISNIRSIGIL